MRQSVAGATDEDRRRDAAIVVLEPFDVRLGVAERIQTSQLRDEGALCCPA